MNMKALLKELVKDPQIKALYKQGFDRSLVNKLIIESLMEQDEDIQIPDAIAINQMYDDEKEQLSKKLRDIRRNSKIPYNIREKAKEALEYTKHSVSKPRPEGQQTPAQPEASPDTKGEKPKRKYDIKQAALTKLGKKYPFKTIVSVLNAQNNYDNIKYLIDQALSHEQIKNKEQQEQAKVAVQNAIETNKNLQPEQKEELKQSVESVAQQKFELVPREWIKGIADKFKNLTPEQKNEILTQVNFILVDDKPEAKEKVSSDLVKLGLDQETVTAIVNNKQAVEELQNALQKTDSQGQTKQLQKLLKGLYDAVSSNDDTSAKEISTKIYNMIKDINGFDEIDNLAKQGDKQTLEDIKKSYLQTYEEYKDALSLLEQEPKQLENDEQDEGTKKKFLFATIVALYNAYNREAGEEPTEEPGQPIPSSGTVSPKKYAELYDENLEAKFDTFEDTFLRTPFLSTQSKVLTELVYAVSEFSNKLSEQEKQSFSRTAEQNEKELQEQEEIKQGIELDRKDQKLIMVEHKVMQKYLKMLVKMVTSIDQEKINTVGFEQDSRKIRAIAKQLLESIIDLMKIIDSAREEGKKGLEFKEGIIKEEEATDDKKPRTQLTRDQIIDLMEQSYDLIVDYGTNIEKYSRTEAEAVELKPVEDAIEKLNQVFAKVLPYFPAHSPFGKTANLKEIKKQVRGISRDIIQVMKQAKGLAEKPENFDEQAITTFASVLLSTVIKLQKYFDLEIDDAEIKAMLPKVPPAKSASYGKDSEGIFSKIQELIKQYSPKVQAQAKKIYEQYSPEVQKALQNGMDWAKKHSKTLGEKAKPYLDKVKQAFQKARQIVKEVWEIFSKGGIDFGDLNLTKEDAEEIINSMTPKFHTKDVLPAVAEWEDDTEPEPTVDDTIVPTSEPTIEPSDEIKPQDSDWLSTYAGNDKQKQLLNDFFEYLKNYKGKEATQRERENKIDDEIGIEQEPEIASGDEVADLEEQIIKQVIKLLLKESEEKLTGSPRWIGLKNFIPAQLAKKIDDALNDYKQDKQLDKKTTVFLNKTILKMVMENKKEFLQAIGYQKDPEDNIIDAITDEVRNIIADKNVSEIDLDNEEVQQKVIQQAINSPEVSQAFNNDPNYTIHDIQYDDDEIQAIIDNAMKDSTESSEASSETEYNNLKDIINDAVEEVIEDNDVDQEELKNTKVQQKIAQKAIADQEVKQASEGSNVSEADIFEIAISEIEKLIYDFEETDGIKFGTPKESFDLKDAEEFLNTKFAKIFIENKELAKIADDINNGEDHYSYYTKEVYSKLRNIFGILKEAEEKFVIGDRFDMMIYSIKRNLQEPYDQDLAHILGYIADLHTEINNIYSAFKERDEEKVQQAADNIKNIEDEAISQTDLKQNSTEDNDEEEETEDDNEEEQDTEEENDDEIIAEIENNKTLLGDHYSGFLSIYEKLRDEKIKQDGWEGNVAPVFSYIVRKKIYDKYGIQPNKEYLDYGVNYPKDKLENYFKEKKNKELTSKTLKELAEKIKDEISTTFPKFIEFYKDKHGIDINNLDIPLGDEYKSMEVQNKEGIDVSSDLSNKNVFVLQVGYPGKTLPTILSGN